jgi:riboflavin biosynthesis pyrimidine reductase
VDDEQLDRLYAADLPGPGVRCVRANFVTSLDGAAELGGRSRGLSGPADQRVLHVVRFGADVILVGAGTVRAEGYGEIVLSERHRESRVRRGLIPVPPVAVVSRGLGLDPSARMFTGEPRPIVLTCAAAPARRRRELADVADVVVCGDGDVDLPAALAALAERGMHRILTEGGPTLFAQLVAAGLVDELCLTVSPLLAGPGHLGVTSGEPWPSAFALTRLLHVLAEDSTLFLRYARPRSSGTPGSASGGA